MEQRPDAITLLERAVQIKPRFAGAWADLAETYTESEDYGKALDAVQESHQTSAKITIRTHDQGSILGKMDDHEGSKNPIRALEIEPQHIEATWAWQYSQTMVDMMMLSLHINA